MPFSIFFFLPCCQWCSVTQLCQTLCGSMDCSLPDFSIHGIFQARTCVGCHFLLQAAVNKTTYYIHFPLPQTALTFLMNFWRTSLSPHRSWILVLSVLSTHAQTMGKETVNVIPTDGLLRNQKPTNLN